MNIEVLGFVLALLVAGALLEFSLAALLVGLWQHWVGELVEGDLRLSADEHRELLAAALQRQSASWAAAPQSHGETSVNLVGEGGAARPFEVVGRRISTLPAREHPNAPTNS